MRKELVKALENKDMLTFVENVTTTDVRDRAEVLFQWNCRVFCHCLMPDDGKQMVQCVECKSWYHYSCEKGDFHDPEWRCTNCSSKTKKARCRNPYLIKLREAAKKFPSKSLLAQQLYSHIVKIHPHDKLNSNAESHIGCISLKDFKSIHNLVRNKCLYGCANLVKGVTSVEPKLDFFITIFHVEIDCEEQFFFTILHEIAHIIDSDGKTQHGRTFQKACKDLVKSVKENQQQLPKPYCDFKFTADDVIH